MYYGIKISKVESIPILPFTFSPVWMIKIFRAQSSTKGSFGGDTGQMKSHEAPSPMGLAEVCKPFP